MRRFLTFALLLLAAPALGAEWTHYGGDAGGMRYVALDQLTPDNVEELEVAWTYSTGDLIDRAEAIGKSAFEATPIIADGKLVFCTPFNEVIALEPATGEEIWRFDPEVALDRVPANQYTCRGVSQWRDAQAGEGDLCARRIFMGTVEAELWALDAETGEPCLEFGSDGMVQVDAGMSLAWPGEFQITSPPAITADAVIVGSSIGDNRRLEAPRGTVRAFDARTGVVRWEFDPVPRAADDPAAGDWPEEARKRVGHANVWSVISVDEDRGLVFLPTSSPSPDFFGGERAGNNRYANSVVALKAATGEVVWHFQTVHHDIWDYDLPAQPALVTLRRDGRDVPAVVQVTKTGFVFVFHRETGEPLFPIEEKEFPTDGVPGEWISPTQPVPVGLPALVPQELTAEDAWGFTFWDEGACRERIAGYRSEGLFTPPSPEGTILFPFTGGGANWGGIAFDPDSQTMFVNTSRMAHVITLIEPDKVAAERAAHPGLEISPQTGAAFGMKRELLLSPLDLPCNPPPWGVLTAIDLSDGTLKWESVLGTARDMASVPIPWKSGTPNLGGPLVTKGGLVFIGATMDYYLRAFDAESGEELWKGRLPAGPQAGPMSYEADGRQYVVIAAGGHSRMGTKPGDEVVAFALPR